MTRLLAAAFALLVAASGASAQTAKNILLVSNSRSSVSREIADYYAMKRTLSSEQVVRVDVPVADEITRADYEARGLDPESAPAFSHHNCAFLLGDADGAIAGPTVEKEGGWLATRG